MKSKSLSAWALACLFVPQLARAEGLSLRNCFIEAKKNNEAVGTQAEAVKQADEKRRQAIGALLPNINGTYSYTWQKDVQSPTQGSISPPYNPLGYVSVTQPLFHGFAEYSGWSKTKASLRQQETLLRNTETQLFQNLAQTYYTILAYEQDLKNLAVEIKYFDERIQELERFRKIGRSQPTDVLTVQTDRSSLLVQMEQIKGQLAATRQTFAYQTGLPFDTDLKDAAGSIPIGTKPLDHYLSRREQRPDVRASAEGLAAAEEDLLISKEAHLPSVDFTYNRYIERAGFQAPVTWDAKLLITVPLFAGGITQSKVRQADSVREQSRLAVSQAQRNAEQEIRATFAAVQADLRQIAQAKETVRISDLTFKQEKHDFRLGLVTNLDVLKALSNYIEALRNLDKGQFTLKADLAHLHAAAAFDLESEVIP